VNNNSELAKVATG